MITDEQWEAIVPKIMALPGMTKDHDSCFMCEPSIEGVSTYIKFMSNHGVTDDANGLVFSKYMLDNDCSIVQKRERSMIVLDVDLTRLFL
jgi:hypothetical protein